MKKRSCFAKTKVSALFTLACFFLTSVCGNFAYAASELDGAAEVIRSSESFVPFSAGKVSYAKNFGSKDIVVNIQDLHCHGESQKNIAAILKSFEKYGFDKIYLEGAVGSVSTQKFIDFREESDLGKLVIDDLAASGTLSGAEYYSIKASKPDIIKPLDQSDLYFENIILLGSILENRDFIRAELEGLRSDIENLKREYYNSDLLRLDKFNRGFAKGEISAKKYYAVLNKLSDKAGINVGAYSNVERYINLIGEKGINYQKVSDELKVFVNVLKENIPYGVYRELSVRSNDFADVNELMPVFTALSDAYGICAKHKLKQLDTFFKYVKTNESLNLLSFIAEEDRLIYDIGVSLAQTKYEREIVFLDRFAKALEGFFTAKITSGDYEYYLGNRKNFEETVSKYLGPANKHLSYLRETMPVFEKYHANNIKRDNVFFSFLSCSGETSGTAQQPSNDFSQLKELMESAAGKKCNIKIVITGGFHSEGLKKRLHENKTSFVIVTPNITGETEKADSMYLSSISEYYQVFTSAINKMPASSDPLQIALPKIIGSTINRARVNQIPLKEAQDLINRVFYEDKSKKSIFETLSLHERVSGAEVKIDSLTAEAAHFTVTYDYGYGKYQSNYIYDFKAKSVSLTVDDQKVISVRDSFYYEGREGYSAPSALFRLNARVAEAVAPLYEDLQKNARDSIAFVSPEKLHITVSAHMDIISEKKSPMQKALPEPLSEKDFLESKNMIGTGFFNVTPFKGRLTGSFKLMPDGAIVYQIDNLKIIEQFADMRNVMQNGNYWQSPKIVHFTIGRLMPGSYTQKDIDAISAVLNKYNQNNLLSGVEMNFENVLFGSFSSTANEDIKVETIKLGSGFEKNAGYIQDIVPKLAAGEIDALLKNGISAEIIQLKLDELFSDTKLFEKAASRTEKISNVEVTLHLVYEKSGVFSVKYISPDGSYTEVWYDYSSSQKNLLRIVNEDKVLQTIDKFFYTDSDDMLREMFSEPVVVVNNKSIAGYLYGICEELSGALSDDQAFLRQPEFYHFSVGANRSVFPKSSEEIALTEILSKKVLRDIESTIPKEVYERLSKMRATLDGYFFLAPDGTIVYKVTNPEVVNAFNEIRKTLNKDGSWRTASDVHFSLGRLLPGENSPEDIEAVNEILERHNADNPLKDVVYTFDNVLFGQFTATGNGFASVVRISPRAKKGIAEELSNFDNITRWSVDSSKPADAPDKERFYEASGTEDMLKAIEGIAKLGLTGYEFTFDVLLPDNYADRTEKEIDAFKRKLISSDELYAGTKNIRDYLLKNAERIKRKAQESGITLSMHAFSIASNAKDKTGKDVPVNPHPGFNGEMRDIFDWQLDIAEALGVKNMTVHLEDYGIDAYAEFVKKAARKKIRINFENHLAHSDNDMATPDSFYFYTLLEGFMGKETFVDTMLAIKKKLTKEEQKYLGVTLDTSKALNSYLKALPLDANFAAINREFAKVSLANLIAYYDAIADAGLSINNIHLAQLSANIDNIKKRGPAPDDMHLVIYNKSNVNDLINPYLDMLEFLRYLRIKRYRGTLHQETPGIVSPIKSGSAKIEIADIAPVMISEAVGKGLAENEKKDALQKRVNEMFLDSALLIGAAYGGETVSGVNVVIDSMDKGGSRFTIRYLLDAKGYVEQQYLYGPGAENALRRTVDESKIKNTIDKFFDNGAERYSEPVVVVNIGSIAGILEGLYGELAGALSNKKAFLLNPRRYHFSVNANRKLFPKGSTDITFDHALSKEDLEAAGKTLPEGVYDALSAIKGKLTGRFLLTPDGSIIYRLSNPDMTDAFNAARRMFKEEDGWGKPISVQFTLGRLMPGQNAQEDIDRINAILDKYNNNNPLAGAEYAFGSVLFGQTSATGNSFTDMRQIDPAAKKAVAEELYYFDNAAPLFVDNGRFKNASNVEEMLRSIEDIASLGLDRYEFTFDLLLPDYYRARSDAEKRLFERKFISSKELYEGLKNIRDYLIANAGAIKQKAKDNNIALSMHSYSLVSFAVNKDGVDVPINPHPGYNGQMKEMFGWQLEIAEALGITQLTVHVEDFDVDGYAEFVKKAAAKKITVNFENHLKHHDTRSKAVDSFYYYTLIQGFLDKETFVKTMLAIKNKLTAEEQKYLGVTFDTSKALNSYLRPLAANASSEEINAELAKVTLKNLIDYYEAVVKAGLTINNIHISQFSANIANVRERKSAELEGGKAPGIYDKSNIDDLTNLDLDMAEFLKYLRRQGYSGAVKQETPGIVSPVKPGTGNTGGFIGEFAAPLVYKVETNASVPDSAVLSVFMTSDSGEVSSMDVGGRFIDAREQLKSVLKELSGQNKSKEFKRVMKLLLKAADRKAASKIKFFEIETAYSEVNGFRENKTAEVGGFSSDRFHFRDDGIIALRKELFENKTALLHEFAHWALAAGAITAEEFESAVTDTQIKERFISGEAFDENAVRRKAERDRGDRRYVDVALLGTFDAVESDVEIEKELYASTRGHNAIRAFQMQYLPEADAELTSLIKSSSSDYRSASMPENEKSHQETKKNIIGRLVGMLNAFAAKKEKEESAAAAKAAGEAAWIEEETDDSAAVAEEPQEAAKPKRAKKPVVKKKAVEIVNHLSVFGTAKLRSKTVLVFDKDVLKHLTYKPGEKVYITSFPGGYVFLFTQPEALAAFSDRLDREAGISSKTPQPFHTGRRVYPNTMDGVIDENGVLKINLARNQINTFAGSIEEETEFMVRGAEHGVVRIFSREKFVREIVAEHDNSKQILDEGARMIEEIIRATESSMFFTGDRMDIALRFLNEDQKHLTPLLKPALESMLKDESLNKDQKAFTLLLLAAISAAENPDFEYVKEQIKNAGAINADALILWIEMIKNPASEKFLVKIIDYLQSRSAVTKYGETFTGVIGSLAVSEELKRSLAASENEKWLLETERSESAGAGMLYGKYFMDAELLESHIDFAKLETLKDFGVKPMALAFGRSLIQNDRNRLGYVNAEMSGKTVTLEVSVRMEKDIPVVLMVPMNFESSMDHKELYVKAAQEVLHVLQNDYTVKGKFAYMTGNISLLERIINLISNESLFRVAGKGFDFDLKAFAFDSGELKDFDKAAAEAFPEAAGIKKTADATAAFSGDQDYYDVSSNILKTKEFIVKVLKRLILKNKESKSNAGVIVGERIDLKIFSMLDAKNSPLVSYGINGLASYFEKRMSQSDSSVILLEDISVKDSPAVADAALVDWASVPAVKKMIAEGKMTENDLRIYGENIDDVRAKSLAVAAKALAEINQETAAAFEKFNADNKSLENLNAASRFAQFILIGQIKENIERIRNNGGKIVISVNISDKMTKSEITRAAAFWQNVGFDGVRMNFASSKMLEDVSLLSSLSAQMRSVKSDFILMAGLPLSLPEQALKNFLEKASSLDIITAVDVSRLADSLSEFKRKIWADINPLNEEYKSDMSKYFEDIQKAVAFGAGYLGVAAGTNVISADGKSVHIEIMSKITEMLSINKTVSVDQAYKQGYKTGLQSKDELKTGTETKKLIVRELIKLQNGQRLQQGASLDESVLSGFTGFLKNEPGIIKLRFVQNSLAENNVNGIYAAAGYLRGMIESSLLSDFRNKNGLDDAGQSELLRTLLLLDFAMPGDVKSYGEDEFAKKIPAELGSMRPDEMLQKMLEESYGGNAAKSFTDYALYIYMLKNNGTVLRDIINNVDALMKAHLSEINSGYGIPGAGSQSVEEKWALSQIIEILALSEHKPAVDKSVKNAINGSVNTLAVSMMLKAA